MPDDPQFKARGTFVDTVHPQAGPFRTAADALHVRSESFGTPTPAPLPGADTDAALRALGYTDERIAELYERGIVSRPSTG